jgi:hypothetical protein
MSATFPSDSAAGFPDFVILGAQKSASTFLQDQMNQHPSVEIAAGESRQFEDPEYSDGAVAQLPALFSSWDAHTVRGIKRPDYLGRPEVPARIARHLPWARLFAVLRDPVPRAVSSYYHYVRHGFVPLMPLDEAFSRLLDGTIIADYPRSREILTYGLYGRHLERYLRYFDRSRLLVFDQKTLISDPVNSMHRAFDFIGVDPAFSPQSGRVSNQGVYSYSRLRFLRSKNHLQFRYTHNLDRRYPVRPGALGYLWVASVVALDRQVLSRIDRAKPPSLSESMSIQLRQYYAEDARLLRSLFLTGDRSFAWLASA